MLSSSLVRPVSPRDRPNHQQSKFHQHTVHIPTGDHRLPLARAQAHALWSGHVGIRRQLSLLDEPMLPHATSSTLTATARMPRECRARRGAQKASTSAAHSLLFDGVSRGDKPAISSGRLLPLPSRPDMDEPDEPRSEEAPFRAPAVAE